MSISITKRPFKRSFSGNPVHYELTSAAAASDPNIFFEFRVMFRYIGGTFQEVFRTSWFPTNGIAEISVHDVLHSQLQWQMPAFPAIELTVQGANTQSGEFYIEFREITPTDQNPLFDTSELDFICTVVRGGINYFQWRGNNFWVNYFNVQKPFLTWQQSGRLATLAERMYLTFLSPNTGNLVVRYQITYMDLSTHLVELNFDAVTDSVYYIPAGAQQCGLDAVDLTKKIYYWDVYVVDVTIPASPQTISQSFRYESDLRVMPNDLTLHYRNSLGGLDSVNIRGIVDETLDYQFQELNQTFKPDYFDSHVITAQRRITETIEQHTYKGDIGYLGKEEQDRFRDAQIQRDVYMKINSKWWPVNITTKNLKLKSTGDMKFSMAIEFTLAYDGADYYTPKSIDLGDGVFTSNVCQATLLDLTATPDFTDGSADPGNVIVNIAATENDPQDASTSFEYSANGGPWIIKNYADLPIKVQFPLDGVYPFEFRTICTGDILGRRFLIGVDTHESSPPPPPPVIPFSYGQISESGSPGTIHQQVFEFTGMNVGDVLPAGIIFELQVYSHPVDVVSTGTETLNHMLDSLIIALNTTTAGQWNDHGSAPAPGTVGFKPSASHTSGSNRITVTLDYVHTFILWCHF